MTNAPLNILVLSDPPAAPGYLPRLRYLCDYMTQKGHKVTLLTEAYQPMAFEHEYQIMEIPMYSGNTIDWAIKTAWTLATDWHNRVFAKRAIWALEGTHYDLVLCTAFSDFPLGAAKRLADYYRIPLLCDIRDLDEQVEDSKYQYHHRTWWTMPFRKLYRTIHIRRRNDVLRAADAITTVSPWHVDFIRQYNANVHLIYNGYDEHQFYPQDISADTFRVTYIGSLFDWQQAPLAMIREVIRQIQLPVLFDCHTPQHNPLAHNELGDAIRQSSIMLVLTNPRTYGMLTTKFYEALGCAKPILCVPSDKGALAELMRYTNAGLATDDPAEIRSFIEEKYREWKQNGFTRQAVVHSDEFSRKTQCRTMENIIRTIMENTKIDIQIKK